MLNTGTVVTNATQKQTENTIFRDQKTSNKGLIERASASRVVASQIPIMPYTWNFNSSI
uniref:AlNc14C66G4678 protein n=1 Tax=Albugo laibachii Nc14 TaxID=890382 RepID=F0WDF8_9STRA|nr:AlNc14C66G4678 [Albugo laibachii Nc14]|eukprot:CCA19230.1 AlNc14C66G4678 [Albugo laibachii Nc14]